MDGVVGGAPADDRPGPGRGPGGGLPTPRRSRRSAAAPSPRDRPSRCGRTAGRGPVESALSAAKPVKTNADTRSKATTRTDFARVPSRSGPPPRARASDDEAQAALTVKRRRRRVEHEATRREAPPGGTGAASTGRRPAPAPRTVEAALGGGDDQQTLGGQREPASSAASSGTRARLPGRRRRAPGRTPRPARREAVVEAGQRPDGGPPGEQVLPEGADAVARGADRPGANDRHAAHAKLPRRHRSRNCLDEAGAGRGAAPLPRRSRAGPTSRWWRSPRGVGDQELEVEAGRLGPVQDRLDPELSRNRSGVR